MNTLEFKEGQIYVCLKSEESWWTEGKEYTVVCNSDGIPVLVDNRYDEWPSNDLIHYNNEFKLKETQSKITGEVLKQDFHEQTYTLLDVKEAIVEAYQTYDNDSQRLAFLKGYFAK